MSLIKPNHIMPHAVYNQINVIKDFRLKSEKDIFVFNKPVVPHP